MAKRVFKILKGDVWFHIFSSVSILLIVVGFVVPPTGIIDGSVFIAVGELFAFASLREVHFAIDKGMDAKIEHGQTTITVGDLNKKEEEIDDAGETTES